MMKRGLWVLLVMCMVSAGTACAFGGAKIVNGSDVMLAYSLKADSVIIVSDQKPQGMELVVGRGAHPPDFENQLVGMKKGDKKVITLRPEQAFGVYRKELIQRVPLTSFPQGIKLREGMMVGGNNGQKIMRVVKILDDSVVIDQNHPLAGKTLTYRVQVEKLK